MTGELPAPSKPQFPFKILSIRFKGYFFAIEFWGWR